MVWRRNYQYFVYILSNFTRSVLYTGVTNDIESRVWEHKNNKSTFTAKYKCHYLMYYEEYSNVLEAIHREKQLKGWRKEWKFELIRKNNPDMLDLAKNWFKGID